MTAPYSLRHRLLTGTLFTVAVVWLVAGGWAWQQARQQAAQVFDAHLAQAASLLVGFTDELFDEVSEQDSPEATAAELAHEIAEHIPRHHYARPLVFQFQEPSGRVLAASPTAPQDRPLSLQKEGFSDSDTGHQNWRVFSLNNSKYGIIIQVAESADDRQALTGELARNLLLPLLITLPLLGLGLTLLVRKGLQPLASLAEQVATRKSHDLSPLVANRPPREIAPLVERLNSLLLHISHSLEQERRFTADAAHELRTPLAAIRAHAEVAQTALTSGTPRGTMQSTLEQVIAATDRATHLIQQLLTLARLDSERWNEPPQACELHELARQVLADLVPSALARDIEVELEEGAPITVEGHPVLLTVLLRNLVENAIHHSPAGGRVSVACHATPDKAWSISDDGPGIPEDQYTEVLQRFHRLPGAPQGGSGLGLSIALRVTELHHAQLRFGRDSAGRFQVWTLFHGPSPHSIEL